MYDDNLIVEHRALFFGEHDEYFEKVIDELGTLCHVRFEYAASEKELIEKCYTYEPMLIVTELNEENTEVVKKVSQIKKYRQAISIGMIRSMNESIKELVDEMAVTDTVMISGEPLKDAAFIIRAYKASLKYGLNIRTLSNRMPIVNQLMWNDPIKDDAMMRNVMSDKLDRLGVKRELLGHKYLIAAIAIQKTVFSVPEPNKLYKSIAEYYGTTASAVEKAIRYAIETAWMVGDIDYQHEVFGMSIDEEKGKPTNAEFIARLSIDF
ncbi:MAG: sporulation initiation factor Spo0A C-terminal domain-containing protein [Clostridia bacterium]|nr:sporulation initiation factor Spo0A C-terminal domain-containing protein [Clostridia bacterium]MBR5718845.1 sporulation initiation factor Spo0A C-terminal domain-containing protein [Clostridia bacterium]